MISPDRPDSDLVAVIGASCRLPGRVDSVESFWRTLGAGRGAVGEPPENRWDAAELDALQRESTRPLVWRGGFLDGDIGAFDAEFFGISGPEADLLDPQHRLLLEVAWEACEHAGLPMTTLTGTDTAVYAGMCNPDHAAYVHLLQSGGGAYAVTGNQYGSAAGRLSHVLGLRGPSMAVDTGCSSGLAVVHLAAQSLRAGECDLALVGAVNVLLSPRTFAAYNDLGVLSPTGRCQSFDADADGYVRAEGCVALVLKRLGDAVRDDDRVLAVLLGTAINHDGRTSRFTLPSGASQEDVCHTAIARAGVDPATIGMVEAHGSGTAAGDRIEWKSLDAVYGRGIGRCAVGSVKSNFGHTESAAGLVGLLKAVLAVRHGEVPASLDFRRLPPGTDRPGSRLHVPRTTEPWPVPGPRRAAVCAYGVGGTNAHAIVGQPPPTADRPRSRDDEVRVFTLSGSSQEALRTAAGRLADWLTPRDDDPPRPIDVAHTLALRRAHAGERLAVVASSHTELITRLRTYVGEGAGPGIVTDFVRNTEDRGPVWVFSGHGSQWPGMAAALLDHDPVFTRAVAELDPLIAAESGFSPEEVLRAGAEVTRFDRVQPMIFTVQVALARALCARGIVPAAVVGHSMGEVAAAVIAGALDLADGARVICRRSQLCLSRTASGVGGMAAVGLPARQVATELAEADARVDVAVIAAPRSTVVGGIAQDVRRLVDAWNERDVPARLVAVDVASHSRLVRTAADDLRDALGGLRPRIPEVPFYTTVLTEPRDRPAFDAAYWAANLSHPVRAAAATEALVADGFRLFQEISPHPVAISTMTATFDELGATEAVALATLRTGEDDLERMWGSIAALHCCGHPVPWDRWYGDGALADVPTTSWHRRHHLIDLQSTRTAPREAAPVTDTHDDTPRQDVAAALRTAPETERRMMVEELVITQLRVVLRLRDRRIRPGSAFAELGLNSLLAVKFRARLATALRMEIPLDLIWQNPTPGALSSSLCASIPPATTEFPA